MPALVGLTASHVAIRSIALSDFFEPPPASPLPEPQRYRTPPWFGAPSGTLPGVVAVERILAQTDEVAVCVTRFAGYPTGFEFDVVTMSAAGQDDVDPMMFHHHHHHPRRRGAPDGIPPEVLRIGLQFSDGSKATNTGGFHHDRHPPAGPVMHPRGGGGGGGRWSHTLWVWPLPPPGPLTLVCEWPAMGIAVTRSELDAKPILDAAARAQVIFSDDDLPEAPDVDDGPSPAAVVR
jgi:hypothetical protein